MALPDLTGQNIENTYQRVLQTDGTNFYDGTGSVVSLGGSQNLQQVTNQGSVTTTPISASIISASGNVNVNNLILPNNGKLGLGELNESFIEFDSTALTIENAAGLISISGQSGLNLSTGGILINVQGQMSSSFKAIFPEITSSKVSGFVTNDGNNRVLTSNGDGTFNAEQSFTITDNSVDIQKNDINIQSQGPLDLRGSINMIGNITASGIVKAQDFVSTDNSSFGLSLRGITTEITGGLDITQNLKTNIITASIISASGTITASNLSGINTGDQDLSLYLLSSQTSSFAVTGSSVLFTNITASNVSASGDIKGSDFYVNSKALANTSGDTVRLGWHSLMPIEIGKLNNPIKLVGQVTASIISASGDITANSITASIHGGTF